MNNAIRLLKKIKSIFNNKKGEGFTILELMVSIVIISIGVLGTYSVIQDIFSSTAGSSHRLTAIYLAQEGVEIIRNERDTNWIESDAWNDGLEFDTGLQPVSDFSRYNRRTNVFLSGSELVVKVDVEWDIRRSSGTISIEERLYDWK